MKKPRRYIRREPTSLLGLRAADQAELGDARSRPWQRTPHWTPEELKTLDRFAAAVRDGRYENAVLAVPDCRVALAKARKTSNEGRELPVRTRQSVHRELIKRARLLGRPWLRPRWTDEEWAMLDRYARHVAVGRFQTAREAGRALCEELRVLHRRKPDRYSGIPDRSVYTIQHELWPRVAKLRLRWFNSHYARQERDIIARYTRRLLAHKYPSVREASQACADAINRMHRADQKRRTGRARVKVVRTAPAVYDQIFALGTRLDPFQMPNRQWTRAELVVISRWIRKYGQHMRGKSKANLQTLGELARAELSRMGYYRVHMACVNAICTGYGHGLPQLASSRSKVTRTRQVPGTKPQR
jgi:hypothetical protein